MSYRDDPEWQEARAAYIEPKGPQTAHQAMLVRQFAAKKMWRIEVREQFPGVDIEELELQAMLAVEQAVASYSRVIEAEEALAGITAAMEQSS